MFRGIPDPESENTGTIDFYQVFNSFLGMYQVSVKSELARSVGQEKLTLCSEDPLVGELDGHRQHGPLLRDRSLPDRHLRNLLQRLDVLRLL